MSAISCKPLRFLHIGDLHITEPGLQNHIDLSRIVDEANTHLAGRIDFAILPGDIADNGLSAQFGLVSREMARLKAIWHAIPGDHDFEPKSLDNFYMGLRARRLPYAEDIGGYWCIFLDVVSRGSGGPDFRLGPKPMRWLRDQLDRVRADGIPSIVFMHTYPADLKDEAAEMTALLDDSTAVLVDMGHTHYNELSNDGRTIYAAARSVGQIEEGDVGFALVAVDGSTVSWRFKTLNSPWPFVMITSPADRRLAIDSVTSQGSVFGARRAMPTVRATAWGAAPIVEAVFSIDDGAWQPMQDDGDGIFSANPALPNRPITLRVRVTDSYGDQDIDSIEIDARREPVTPTGSDARSIGAWPERHLFGTQLGPNRNGRKW